MKGALVPPEAIRFDFAGQEIRAEPAEQMPGNRLYLDLGGDLRAGVIDHKRLAAYTGSTASLVLAHPELVRDAIRPDRTANALVTLVVHVEPDLDCAASAYLARSFLSTGHFPDGAGSLTRYVDRAVAGHACVSQDRPFTLYAAYKQLAHRLGLRGWEDQKERWRALMDEGLKLIAYVLKKAVSEAVSLMEVDAFQCPGLFSSRDRDEVRADLERYHQKLASPDTHARKARLRLPSQFGGTTEVDALLVRDVQNLGDPQRVMFFKDWARTDRHLASNGTGFAALSVFHTETPDTPRRCILSVTPESGAALPELGRLIEEVEEQERKAHHGGDNRTVDPENGRALPVRDGEYPNADPWYDGRGHGRTIIDSPRSGTVLSAEQIEDLFLHYGGRAEAEIEPIVLPTPLYESATQTVKVAAIRQLSAAADGWRARHDAQDPGKQPEVFLSYPRKRLDWVRDQLYARLKDWLGEERIFFDRHTLNAGAGWLARLAAGVAGCRVFLAVYCDEYFRSDFCEWELQMALIRDPTGRKEIVVPLRVDAVALPAYCSLIQAEDATGEAFWPRIRDRLIRLIGVERT